MGVESFRTTQYYIDCDECGIGDTVADSMSEHIHSKQQAIRWAKMHKVKDGRVLCDDCFAEYKKVKRNET